MSAQHTPGPWRVYEGPLRRGFPTPIIEIKAARSDRPVVNWQGFDDGNVPAEIHRANARLIAAAPDLLAALKLAKSLFDANTKIGRIGDHTQINAAIDKAEGWS